MYIKCLGNFGQPGNPMLSEFPIETGPLLLARQFVSIVVGGHLAGIFIASQDLGHTWRQKMHGVLFLLDLFCGSMTFGILPPTKVKV